MNLVKLYITLFIFCLFSACNKADLFCSTDLYGKWELRKVQAGMIPTINHTPGNGNILEFTREGYRIFKDGQLIQSGTYTLTNDPSVKAEVCLEINSGEFTQRIIYDNDLTKAKVFIDVSNDKLKFLSGCFALDGGSFKEYARL